MLKSFLLPIATLALLYQHTFAQSNTFSNPPVPGVIHDYSTDPIWHIGTTQNITWDTNYDRITLVLWQNDNASAYGLISDQTAQQYITWNVEIDGTFKLSDGNVFFFQIFEVASDGSLGDSFASHYFNITDAPATTTTSTLSATATSTSAATSSSSSSSGGGLSTGAEIGIGVGVGIVGLALILAALLYYLRKRRSNSGTYSRAKGTADSPPDTGYAMEQPNSAPAYTTHDSNPQYPAYIPQSMRNDAGESYPTDQKHLAEVPGAMHAAPVELSSEQAQPQELMANDAPKPPDQGGAQRSA